MRFNENSCSSPFLFPTEMYRHGRGCSSSTCYDIQLTPVKTPYIKPKLSFQLPWWARKLFATSANLFATSAKNKLPLFKKLWLFIYVEKDSVKWNISGIKGQWNQQHSFEALKNHTKPSNMEMMGWTSDRLHKFI